MIDDGFRLMPEQASTLAPSVDLLYYFLLSVSTFFTVLIAVLIVYFSIKYRRGNQQVDRSKGEDHSLWLEVLWMVVPLLISMAIFAWGASLYYSEYRPPDDAIEIRGVGKQWMWKFQHPSGQREINDLHVPLGYPVKLTLISEDVIHSFFVPAFRTKRDVVPGRYTNCWFEATRTGTFHLFCAEYCGTNHSRMIGRVIVMEPAEYERWLANSNMQESPLAAGKRLYEEFRCVTCHRPEGATGRCPPLEGLFGRDVKLVDGTTVPADETYLRESILRPAAKVVAGFEPLMPSYEGQISEEQLIYLITYIKSLAKP
ncbi:MULTISPECIES: cytochrome c oxidase subunit II [unclassified Schlesneria]|uniref:cytochrome c oxidase subunit II n=1 Tax=unclassified Schlesneria TaxID=2762017 RepID=UPI002EE919C3